MPSWKNYDINKTVWQIFYLLDGLFRNLSRLDWPNVAEEWTITRLETTSDFDEYGVPGLFGVIPPKRCCCMDLPRIVLYNSAYLSLCLDFSFNCSCKTRFSSVLRRISSAKTRAFWRWAFIILWALRSFWFAAATNSRFLLSLWTTCFCRYLISSFFWFSQKANPLAHTSKTMILDIRHQIHILQAMLLWLGLSPQVSDASFEISVLFIRKFLRSLSLKNYKQM